MNVISINDVRITEKDMDIRFNTLSKTKRITDKTNKSFISSLKLEMFNASLYSLLLNDNNR